MKKALDYVISERFVQGFWFWFVAITWGGVLGGLLRSFGPPTPLTITAMILLVLGLSSNAMIKTRREKAQRSGKS